MLIGLISDTHVCPLGYRAGLSLLKTRVYPDDRIKEVFRGVDLILHAGDIYALPVLDELELIAPVLAAEGDDDPFEAMNDPRVKQKHILRVDGLTIGVGHLHEMWNEQKELLDVLVFGHTHESCLENNGGTLRINPGSPTFPRYHYRLGTVGLLNISSGKAEADLIQL